MPAGAAIVVVLGNLHLDILVSAPARPRKGETVLGSAWDEKCGGKGGNQAVEAARHGSVTSLIGAVGDDAFGATLVENLRAMNVGTDHVRVVAGARSGMSAAIFDKDGDYGAVIVPGANWHITSEDIDAAGGVLRGAALLLLQNEAPEAINLHAARLARRGEPRIVLNAAPARETSPELLGMVDVLVVNSVEAEMMGAGRAETLEEANGAAEQLLALVPSAIVTAGAAGLAVARRSVAGVTIAGHRIAAISSHGAGDAFIGALAARLAEGDSLRDAARYANAAAAALVSTPEEFRSQLRPSDTLRLLGR